MTLIDLFYVFKSFRNLMTLMGRFFLMRRVLLMTQRTRCEMFFFLANQGREVVVCGLEILHESFQGNLRYPPKATPPGNKALLRDY